MAKPTGDELIEYGFRRILEEMQGIRSSLEMLTASIDKLTSAARATASKTDNIEQHVMNAVGVWIEISNSLDKVKADTMTTALNVIRIGNALKEESNDGAGQMEDV